MLMNGESFDTEVERLQAILRGGHINAWQWNVITDEVIFNDSWETLLGYKAAELQPITVETWRQLCHPDDLIKSDQLLHDYFTGARSEYQIELRLRHKKGHWIWVRDTGLIATRTADGQPEWLCGGNIDITDLMRSREQLTESQQRLKKIADNVHGFLYQFQIAADGEMTFPYASAGIKHIYGITPEQANANNSAVFGVIHEKDIGRVKESIERSKVDLSPWELEYRVILSGEVRWLYGHAIPERTADGGTLWHGIIIDNTEQKLIELQLAETQLQLQQAQRVAALGYWKANIEDDTMTWSDTLYKMFGENADSYKPSFSGFIEHVHPADRAAVIKRINRHRQDNCHYEIDFRIVRTDGHIRWVRQWGLAVELGDRATQCRATLQDVTERKELELKLIEESTRDALTKLYNRRYFMEYLKKRFMRQRRDDTREFCIISFDFDLFKNVNDRYGHLMGDEVLRVSARLTLESIRETDIAARVGGEEFAIFLPRTTLDEARQLAERLRKTIAQYHFHTEDSEFSVTITCGVTACMDSDKHYEDVLARADRALYHGKNNGRNQVVTL